MLLTVGTTMLGHADAVDWNLLYAAVPAAFTALITAFTADLFLAIAVGTVASACLWAGTGRFLRYMPRTAEFSPGAAAAASADAAAIGGEGVRCYPPSSTDPLLGRGRERDRERDRDTD